MDKRMKTNNISASRQTTAIRSVMAEKVRAADAHSPKRWAAGPTTSSTQYALVYVVAATRTAAYSRRSQQQLLAGKAKNGQTGLSIDRCSSRRTRKIRYATSSWAAVWRAVTAEIM